MKHLLLIIALTATLPVGMAAPVLAKPIQNACLQSAREAVSYKLCGCIQSAADITLTRRDQRQAAKFFDDPQRAQDVRQSDRSTHESFWQKYKRFGETAEAYCS
ncbi:hypothetical protein [Nereida sp. NH-UV-3]|uniref:hypothetical protein n=1 Tax=Nereida TaxID=282198 RepID=UPI0036F2ECA6